MARIRAIKPGFFLDDELYELELSSGFPVRVAWAGLWCQADKEGRFKWQPRRLKNLILPYDEVDFSDVLDALKGAGFLMKYEAGGEMYGAVPNWLKHQRPHHKESASTIPPPTTGYSLPDPGFARGRDGAGTVPTPERASADPLGSGVLGSGSGSPLTPRKRRDPLLRRFLRGGSPPDGHLSWSAFFGSMAQSLNISAEAATERWILERGGQEAVDAARSLGLVAA